MATKYTPRERESQRTVHVSGNGAHIECLTCEHVHGVDRDEDGGAGIDQQPCHADDCYTMLCSECPQFKCEGCGLVHCMEHRIMIEDGCGGIPVCPVCFAKDPEAVVMK